MFSKLHHHFGLLALATLFLQVLAQPTDKETFLTFKDHLEKVKTASYDDYRYDKDAKVGSKEDFEEMRSHILTMYKAVNPDDVKSFVQDGQYGDCIPIKEQPSLHLLGLDGIDDPPEKLTISPKKGRKDEGELAYADSPLKLGLKDIYGNPISCQTYTIPMARLTLEKMTSFGH